MPYATDPIPPKSKEWRDRAKQYRRYADEAQTPEGRKSYLEVAASCDEIADRVEKLERSGRPI
jgi:hypothetical protein